MSYDDPIDDEEWYVGDDDSSAEADETEIGLCPECRDPVYEFTSKCPACGYLLSDADLRRLGVTKTKPIWVLITATVILVVLLFGVLTLRF